jgi:hypothetical protein
MFRFNQGVILRHDEDGLCFGISAAMLAHLFVNNDFDLHFSAETAFEQAMAYTSMLRFSYDRNLDRVSTGFLNFRSRLLEVQRSESFASYSPFLSEGATARLLGMACTEGMRRTPHGSMYRRACMGVETNHCGVIVWDSNNAFVFDPNMGGLLFRWLPARITRLPAAVDMLLERQYQSCGLSHLKVKTCAMWDVDLRSLPTDLG